MMSLSASQEELFFNMSTQLNLDVQTKSLAMNLYSEFSSKSLIHSSK